MGLFRRERAKSGNNWRVVLETTCPMGYAAKQKTAMTKIIPRGCLVEDIKVDKGIKREYVTFTIDCRDSRRFSKFTRRIYAWESIASTMLNSKTATKTLTKLADDPKDVDIVKDLVVSGTTMRIVKRNEL